MAQKKIIQMMALFLISAAVISCQTNIPTEQTSVNTNTALIKQSNTECSSDNECVASQCCHATTCVATTKTPQCSGIACTMDCEIGTMDCGAGKCACERGKCTAIIT